MTMIPPVLQVAVNDRVALVKISGRAAFNCGVDFKSLIYGLRDRGHRRFVFDLTDCPIMDSTFLGILAGFAVKLNELFPESASLHLLNPNERVSDLLDNLGVAHLFRRIEGRDPLSDECREVAGTANGGSKLETSRTCLEAHETLMAIDPANVPKFKDVTRFMAEDLKRQESDQS